MTFENLCGQKSFKLRSGGWVRARTTRKSGANTRAICAPKPALLAVMRTTFCAAAAAMAGFSIRDLTGCQLFVQK